MKLKEIAAISGKPGLYKILKSTPKGVIVETLDEQKKRSSMGISHRVSLLKEISIYTTDEEGVILLEQALYNIHQKYNGEIPVHKKSEESELISFMEEIIPQYDRNRVFMSDMKKLVSWYGIIFQFSPETFDTLLVVDEEEEESKKETEVKKGKKADNPGQKPVNNRAEKPSAAKATKTSAKPKAK